MFVCVLVVLCIELGEGNGERKICTNNRHIAGHWKLKEHHMHNHNGTEHHLHLESNTTRNESTSIDSSAHHHVSTTLKKSFYCCGWELNDFLSNTTECGTTAVNGDNIYWGSTTTATQSGGHACQCDKLLGRYTVHPREWYEWVPTFCDILQWNATQFCDLLGNRTILLVGDSTMQQTASTLMSMVTASGGKCANQIANGRSNYLLYSARKTDTVFNFVNQINPDICIMAAGAWLHDFGDMQDIWQNLMAGFPAMRQAHPKTKFVWKTQNPGHHGCENYHEPVKTPIITFAAEDYFQYNLFPQFDELAHNNSAILGMKVLDMYQLYLRPDGHADCMHFCMPGPLDLFSNLLLTMLYNREI